MLKKMIKFILKRKLITIVIIIAIFMGGYFIYNAQKEKAGKTGYVLGAAEKGTIIASVSGSGQVSASNSVDIQPKVSGSIINLAAKVGQEVKAGDFLVQIDAKDAQKSVRDAEASLEVAQLSLEKLKSANSLSITQAQNAFDQANESKQEAQDNLAKAYDDGFNAISNAFLDLPTVMAGLNDLLYGFNLNTIGSQVNIDYYTERANAAMNDTLAFQYRDSANSAYAAARTVYDQNFNDYKLASRYSDTVAIESLINETYETDKRIAEAVKSANNLIQFYKDKMTEKGIKPNAAADTHLANLATYVGKTNSQLSSLLSIKNTIQNNKKAIVNADRSIEEKAQSLADLQAGADPLDIKSQELTIRQRQDALSDAREKLADYSIKAPFDGVIAAVNVEKGDSVSSGVAIATLITKQQVAEISLNEVDAAKVKVGQKVTLTFDAVEGLNLTGQVAVVDAIGTVSQGVVTYKVEIGFDTQDERVKPGMSVSSSIITDSRQDVVMVPNSAIKTSNGLSYVEVISNPKAESGSQEVTSDAAPQERQVEVGLANDSYTEILSGLKEGDQVVTRTVSSATTQSAASQGQSIFQVGGASRVGGGFSR